MTGHTDYGALTVPDAREQIEGQLTQVREKFGPPLGYERVHDEQIGSSLMRLLYVLRYDKQPIVAEMIYYRADDSWTLINVRLSVELRMLWKK